MGRMFFGTFSGTMRSGILEFMYTGDYIGLYDYEGFKCWRFTTSGDLIILNGKTLVDLCVCGGGSRPGVSVQSVVAPSYSGASSYAGGGAGGHLENLYSLELKKDRTLRITVGAAGYAGGLNPVAGGRTQIQLEDGTVLLAANGGSTQPGGASGCNGGSGGGRGYTVTPYYETHITTYGNPGTGDGKSKYPFGDENYFLPHCAGGAGHAGAGGSNGSGGLASGSGGGAYGGGGTSGIHATFFGGGGAAGPLGLVTDTTDHRTPAGSGYQGCVYLRMKA